MLQLGPPENPAGEKERERPRVAEGGPQGIKLPGKVLVVGKVSRFRKDGLSVQIPGATLAVTLAEDAVVNVHITDKKIAFNTLQRGDRIHVHGFYQEAGQVYAQQITAKLQRKLGADPEKPQKPEGVAAAEPAFGEQDDLVDPHGDFTVGKDEKPKASKPGRVRVLKIN